MYFLVNNCIQRLVIMSIWVIDWIIYKMNETIDYIKYAKENVSNRYEMRKNGGDTSAFGLILIRLLFCSGFIKTWIYGVVLIG